MSPEGGFFPLICIFHFSFAFNQLASLSASLHSSLPLQICFTFFTARVSLCHQHRSLLCVNQMANVGCIHVHVKPSIRFNTFSYSLPSLVQPSTPRVLSSPLLTSGHTAITSTRHDVHWMSFVQLFSYFLCFFSRSFLGPSTRFLCEPQSVSSSLPESPLLSSHCDQRLGTLE